MARQPERAAAPGRQLARELDRLPLATLLSWAWLAFTIEADNAFEASGAERFRNRFRVSLAMWANGLRLIEDGLSVAQLRAGAGAACNLGGLERWGWIRVGDATARRDGYGTQRGIKPETTLRPTSAGVEARRLWPQIIARIEAAWRRRFGTDVIGSLRRSAAAPFPPMPWSPPEVHPSDGFYTHVTARKSEDDADPPLVAVLGQLLTRMTLEAEGRAGVSMPIGANFLRVIDSATVPVHDLPARSGVSKEAVAMAVGYLTRRGLAESGPARDIRLTPAGQNCLKKYGAAATRPRDPDLRAALGAVLSRPDVLAEGLVPPEGCWRAQRPYLTHTRRLLADPLGTLPWQPMVLHRGGWPDGS